MTLCNMAVEAGGRTGIIAPDETTFAYRSYPYAPSGDAWDKAVAAWRELRTDENAVFDREVTFDASALEPMVTYGTSPGWASRSAASSPSPALTSRRQRRCAT